MSSRKPDEQANFRTAIPVRQITPAVVQARLSSRLRQLIGPGKRMTLLDAAGATGIAPRTLKAYVEGRACPNLARYGRLLRVFGPEVGIELAMMIGWEPRASNPKLPHTEDLRTLRDAIARAIQAIDFIAFPEKSPARAERPGLPQNPSPARRASPAPAKPRR